MTTLPDLRRVQTAEVFKGDECAAVLRRGPSGTILTYLEGYRGPAIARDLPVGQDVVSTAGAVPPFLANLLPEGRRLTALQRASKTSADDDLTLLLAVGGDTIGDVRILADVDGVAVASPTPLVEAVAPHEVSFREVLAEAGFVDRVGIPGIQEKLSAGMITLPVQWQARPALIKLDPADYPNAVVNEGYFLQIARRLGQPVVDAAVVYDRDRKPGLIVSRFDRADSPDVRFAVEDACQLLSRYPADKYAVSAEEVITAVADACHARPVALRNTVRQFVLAWATGNGDLHAKNIAVLQTNAEWAVAPIYDIPSTLMWGDDSMALEVGGRVRGLTRARFIELGRAVGLPERAAVRVVDDVLHATDGLADDIASGGLAVDRHTRLQLARRLRARRKTLLG